MTLAIHVTRHACERYVERVDPGLTVDEARDAILTHARAVKAAVSFGCRTVILGEGGRLLLDGASVVTVYAKRWRP